MMNLMDSTKQQVWSQPLQVSSQTDPTQSFHPQPQQPHPNSLEHPRTLKRNWDETVNNHKSSTTGSSGSKDMTASPSLKPSFKLRPLSLDRGAVAPALKRPAAPFAKSERKKAYVSAIYYSECFLRNIKPIDADSAAFDIQNQYKKWWVQSKNKKEKEDAGNKRQRLIGAQPSSVSLNLVSPFSTSCCLSSEKLTQLKEQLITHLQETGGDTTTPEFQSSLAGLRAHAKAGSTSTNSSDPVSIDGTWLSLSKPTFSECQGRNENGEYMYSLGRMSFDMFRPTHLKCSIRAVMNNIRLLDPTHLPESFPRHLGKELSRHRKATAMSPSENPIRHYDIVVAFTIEANQTRLGTDPKSSSPDEFVVPRPIRGLMTNYGYLVADPTNTNRSSIWFSGGSIEVQDEVADGAVWRQIFDESLAPRRDMRAVANVLAAKLLLGAYTTTTSSTVPSSFHEEDLVHEDTDHANKDSQHEHIHHHRREDEMIPTMSYFFKRPIGGHGEVYCDTLYADETMRIMQGHRGSIFVFTRVPTE